MSGWLFESLLIVLPSAVLALSYFPTVGLAGNFVLCNAAWAGVSAYGLYVLAINGTPLLIAIVVAISLALMAALATWLASLRTRGLSQTMSSVAMSAAIVALISSSDSVTGGEQGLLAPPVLSAVATPLILI